MFRFFILTLLLITSCSSLSIDQFDNSSPQLKIEDYFSGHVRGIGIVLDRSGAPLKQFSVDLHGSYDQSNTQFVLEEDFTYSDGLIERRVWNIIKKADDTYEGTAKDVIGTAHGNSKGQALHWTYTLKVPYGNGTIDLDFNDWMFLQSDKKTLINKAIMTKYGITVGEVILFFTKQNIK